MIRMPSDLKGEWVKGERLYRLTHALPYRFGRYYGAVPAGFVMDGASIPRVLWNILDPWDPDYRVPACVHDYDYRTGIIERAVADHKFLIGMKLYGAEFWKRQLIYRGVRVGGWVAWNEHRKLSEKG